VQRDTTRESSQGWLALDCESDLGVYNLSTENPAGAMEMMERIVAPSNVREAYRRVKRNGGCPGVDGMTVEELAEAVHPHPTLSEAMMEAAQTLHGGAVHMP